MALILEQIALGIIVLQAVVLLVFVAVFLLTALPAMRKLTREAKASEDAGEV